MSSPDAGQRFLDLLTMMARLRGDGGCPWDREQTRESLRPFLVEETYEVLDALDSGDAASIREELGDLLFQVVFHGEIARERGEFSMTALLDALIAKMTRRHPHVFGDQPVSSAAEALSRWEAIKESENHGPRRATLAGVPRAMPALSRAQRVQHKAARVGFDWPDATGALEKAHEELGEVTEALRGSSGSAVREELGDLLFSVVNVARLAKVDPEDALQAAVDRFSRRFGLMEEAARSEGRDLAGLSLDELERLWTQAKSHERPA
ncbi:MAG TPA: nucleoside triphosphate pyrophosphohydrolase [Methylomirabilota bacterium]|jgi:tetrapyrrole methylase family protein/MazG family protein|nr:nucleoside triphosphate pyrophosphohydrolase [Methylomirabilota bacterium]